MKNQESDMHIGECCENQGGILASASPACLLHSPSALKTT